MEQITVRLPADTLASADSLADEQDESRSKVIRAILDSGVGDAERGGDYNPEHTAERIAELEEVVEQPQAERDDLRRDVERLEKREADTHRTLATLACLCLGDLALVHE